MIFGANIIVAFIIGIIIIFLIGKIFLFPLKIILKLAYNAIIGGIVLVLINIFGSYFGFHIALNFISALLVGIFGVPGIVLLVLLKLFY